MSGGALQRDPLRIGVVIDDVGDLSICVRRVLEAICKDERFRLAAVFSADAKKSRAGLVFAIATAAESAVFSRRRNIPTPCFDAAVTELTIENLSVVSEPVQRLDVIIDFLDAPLAVQLASTARFGLWRLSSNDAVAGFFETLNRAPVTEVSLLQYANKSDLPREIARAAYNTKFVASRNTAFVREKASQLIMCELARIWLHSAPADNGPVPAAPPRKPGVPDLAAYGVRLTAALFDRIGKKVRAKAGLRPGMFMLRYGPGGPDEFDPAKGVDIVPSGDQYWADPFLFRYGGATYVFFENYEYATRRGHISVGRIEGNHFEFIGTAIAADYHLSYPFVFEHDGEIYMMPETSQARRIEVWRLEKFPDQWELHATVLDGEVTADSVLYKDGEASWLFTNKTNDSYGDHNSELHLYNVDGPSLRKLEPHPLNPVVIDAQSARGGGRVFQHNGRLLRASQNNSHGIYGYGLNLMEICRLDMLDYKEKVFRRIEPDFDRDLIGCHHVDFLDGYYIIDLRKKRGGRA